MSSGHPNNTKRTLELEIKWKLEINLINKIQISAGRPQRHMNLLLCDLLIWLFLFWLTGVVFSNGTMLSMTDKYDSVNERTQEISESVRYYIL